MQLTRYSDLSLRVLIYLAVHPGDLATIEQIAEAYGISRAHVMKVAHQLGRAGFLETVRGRGGGLRLARAPESIRVGDVVRQTEGRIDLVECFGPGTSDCRIEPVCGLRGLLEEAVASFLRTLDACTLSDLVARRRKPLERLLTVS
jgi:Rrf2 family nitric oxide-sensitive transcriptional repressor